MLKPNDYRRIKRTNPQLYAAIRDLMLEVRKRKTREWYRNHPRVRLRQTERFREKHPDQWIDGYIKHMESYERSLELKNLENFWFHWPSPSDHVTIAHYVAKIPVRYMAAHPWGEREGCQHEDCPCHSPALALIWWNLVGSIPSRLAAEMAIWMTILNGIKLFPSMA